MYLMLVWLYLVQSKYFAGLRFSRNWVSLKDGIKSAALEHNLKKPSSILLSTLDLSDEHAHLKYGTGRNHFFLVPNSSNKSKMKLILLSISYTSGL